MRQDVFKALDAHLLRACDEIEDAARQTATVPTREQLAEIGGRALAIGHELRQPFFTIALVSENLRQMLEIDDLPRDKMLQALDRIDGQIARAQDIVAEALNVVSDEDGEPAPSDVVEAMRNAIVFLGPYFAMSGIDIEQGDIADSGPVMLSRTAIEQVFVNVLRNAGESIQSRRRQGWRGEGRVDIEVLRGEAEVCCTISDNGAGLVEGVSQAAFRPFFTTKPSEGTGLGLSICQSIVEAVGGAISLRAGETAGAVVEIRLPLFEQPGS